MLTRLDLQGQTTFDADVLTSATAATAPDVPAPDLTSQLESVRQILAQVKAEGDRALLDLARRFDGAELDNLAIPHSQVQAAPSQIEPQVRSALETAARRIRDFHASQPRPQHSYIQDGIAITQRIQPVASAGLYIPGGRASYPSTVLMCAIVAKVAGVERLVMCTPPAPDGTISQVTLAAAALAGVDEVYTIGGAGAIAALAWGTQTIRPTDVIAGPGNIFVTLAQREVAGQVGVATAYAGPSEIVVVVDETADVSYAAADLLTQSEHGPGGRIVLIATSEPTLEQVCERLEAMVQASPRQADIRDNLAAGGHAVLVDNLESAVALSDAVAPEHLQLMCRDAEALAGRVRNAGAIFCGPMSSVVLGDYVAGPSHVLPTGGAARFASGLQVGDFQKVMHTVAASAAVSAAASSSGFSKLVGAAAVLAEQEGLLAHRDAIVLRRQQLAEADDRATAETADDTVAAAASDPAARPAPQPYIQTLQGYFSPQVSAQARLNTNESPFAPPPEFLEAVSASLSEIDWQRYPQRSASDLCEQLAELHQVDPSEMFVANGSNEVLQSLLMCYGAAGRDVLVFEPSYRMHTHIAQSLGSNVVAGPRAADMSLDLAQAEQLMRQVRPSLTFVCSPNNPTGIAETPETLAAMLELAKSVGSLLVVDEAYVEFSPHSALDLFGPDVPLAITRTYSKTWAMAAARLGYAIAPDWVIRELDKVGLPYRLSQVSQTVGHLALRFRGQMKERVGEIVAERTRVCDGLAALGVEFWPSSANFVLFRAGGAGESGGQDAGQDTRQDASQSAQQPSAPPPNPLWSALLDRSVLVRDCSSWPGLGGCLRVTIGTPQENDLFLKALQDALGR